jgi:arsenate reductase
MQIKIYHNPRCSKSRQSFSLLQENGIEPTVVEYLKTPPNQAEIKQLLKLLQMPAADIVRTGEAEFKAMGKDLKTMSEEEVITMLAEHPKLMERPIIVADDKRAVVGRPPENVLKLIT